MIKKRPSFKSKKNIQKYSSPEELFSKLPNRAATHGYLRAPQVDAIRDYLKNKDRDNIAFELPTGTGKTTVGLLIAEWRRRKTPGNKVAFLTLTNQLAGQVLAEAENLGIKCADLRGTKETRSAKEVGKYLSGNAIAVTTYSNLFNVNPVIRESDLIIFDDAHGGEQYVSKMWTVEVKIKGDTELFGEILTALRPAMSDSQFSRIADGTQVNIVEHINLCGHNEILKAITSILDEQSAARIKFPWSQIRNNLKACLIFVSRYYISIRPIIPPTYEHLPFSNSNQRIYMSATLGGKGDLLRSYGVTSMVSIKAPHAQWGRRYIFTPGLYVEENEIGELISKIWEQLDIHRALILTPSFEVAERTVEKIADGLEPFPEYLGASDIEDSIESFTSNDNSILCLAGRYDGLDLPGDDCRLLIMAESPAAVGPLERYQKEQWKLGPLLRQRERTRLIQGMGRCTRDATDFAVIILLEQSLINSVNTPLLTQGLPSEIQRELKWGIEQSEVAGDDKEALADMIVGLLVDSEYRVDANESMEELDSPETVQNDTAYDTEAKQEVLFSQILWDGNYSKAYEIAFDITDRINDKDLQGYKAWWFYLASIAGHFYQDLERELECLKKARSIGINSGFLDYLIKTKSNTIPPEDSSVSENCQVELIWEKLNKMGWNGPKFKKNIDSTLKKIETLNDATQYHMGIEFLGQCLGAETIRSKEDGAPDIVWIFAERAFTFEAKTNKKGKNSMSKTEIQQAEGHIDWLVSKRPDINPGLIKKVIIAKSSKIKESAEPFVKELNFISVDQMKSLSNSIFSALKKIRTEFNGKEYSAAFEELKFCVKDFKMDVESIDKELSKPLAELAIIEQKK